MLSLVLAPPAAGAPAGVLELRAEEVTVRSGGAVIDARGAVQITDGTHRVRADRAVYTVRDRRIELTGHVAIDSPDATLAAARAVILLTRERRLNSVEAAGGAALTSRGRLLKASRVSYIAGGEAITASGNVSLSLPPDLVATGQQLVATPAMARLAGRARVQTRDGSIEGDTLEVMEREQVAYVRGNVVSVVQTTTITAGAATLYGKERKVVFRDPVHLRSPGRVVEAEVVSVFYAERRIVAEGETTIRIEEEAPQRP